MTVGAICPDMRWVCSHLFTVAWLVLCCAGLFATYVVKVIA